MPQHAPRPLTVLTLIAGLMLGLTACVPSNGRGVATAQASDCIIPQEQILDGGPGQDGIPALTNPTMVAAEEADYVQDDHRVIGLMLDGRPVAIPHNTMWWHEIVNLDAPKRKIAVTYCPLTGSPIGYDRAVINGSEFGVSGKLYKNNLVMYDRNATESLWSQMLRKGACGADAGTKLTTVPVIDMTWRGWRDLHPDTRVVAEDTGYERDYTRHPYGEYENPNNDKIYFPLPRALDERRPPKERVLGVPAGSEGGVAFPFGALGEDASVRVVQQTVQGEPVAVFWDGRREAAAAYRPAHDGEPLEFEVRGGEIVDAATGSTWRIDGVATGGPLAGARLEAVPGSYVAFWFAWAAFQPETQIWTAEARQ